MPSRWLRNSSRATARSRFFASSKSNSCCRWDSAPVPRDPRYRPRYEGGVVERDSAYHHGTVWPFLLGPFVTAWVKIFGESVAVRKTARGFLAGLESYLQETCLGQVSEMFDAEAPHRPRGCFAQAWSIAESLRALVEDLGFRPRLKKPRQNRFLRTSVRKRFLHRLSLRRANQCNEGGGKTRRSIPDVQSQGTGRSEEHCAT